MNGPMAQPPASFSTRAAGFEERRASRPCSNASGFGLGLSLVERLAQHFGWRVLLTPLSPHGTRAELRWPEGRSEH